MSGADVLWSALRGVGANKMRSALTLLGVLIGVAAVIVLTAVGNGSAQSINNSISGLGAKTITVRPESGRSGPGAVRSTAAEITAKTASDLGGAGLGHVATVTPLVTSSQTVTAGTVSQTAIEITGSTAGYFAAQNLSLASGRGFTQAEVTGAEKVAVLGSTAATSLFPRGTPIGQSVNIGGTSFTVVGVLATQDGTGFTDPNAGIVAPITRVQDSFAGYGPVSSLQVEAKSAEDVTAAQAEVQIVLNQLLGVTDADNAPYSINNQAALLTARQSTATTFTVLLAAVAGISLLVGGIGVTNIMLVTVTERTREIGIRKALGATRTAILSQFLAEAALLTLLGGVLGVAVALVVSRFPISGTQPVIVASSIPIALGVSVAIGVFFGVYPAFRAAAMRPVEALRSL